MASSQFSLRSALLTLPAFSVFFYACFALPDALSGVCLLLLSMLVITILVVVIIFGSGNARAFCIGAIIPVVHLGVVASVFIVVFLFGGYGNGFSLFEETAPGLRLVSGIIYVASGVTGFLAIAIRHFVISDR